MHPERTLAEGKIDHLDDSIRDSGDIRIERHDGSEAFEHLIPETCIGTGFVIQRSAPEGQAARPACRLACWYIERWIQVQTPAFFQAWK